jgi:hypothetical protein
MVFGLAPGFDLRELYPGFRPEVTARRNLRRPVEFQLSAAMRRCLE